MTFAVCGFVACGRSTLENRQFQSEDERIPQVFYGEDHRHEPYEISDPQLLKVGFSTVALIHVDRISKVADGRIQVLGPLLKQTANLCPTELYLDQVAGAFCT